MDNILKRYISSNFTKSFLILFIPFFMIISLIYLIKISTLTSQISLSMSELFLLYLYSIPDIVFYTIPISFVAATANLFTRLSIDNELVALFSLGVKSKYIVKRVQIIAILFTLLLLSISFLAIPISKQYYKSFKNQKQDQAQLNLNAGELGQKFGEYYVYIESKDPQNSNFNNIVIYNKDKHQQEKFFAASKANLVQSHKTTLLKLFDGYGYTYDKNSLEEAQYKQLNVYKRVKETNTKIYDIIEYWSKIKTTKKLKQKALFMVFVSFIPIISLYIVASFTIINPRYQQNNSYVVIFVTTLILYTLASILRTQSNIYLLIFSIISILIFGSILIRKQVYRFF